MSKTEYPKGKTHPNSRVGEQMSTTWPEHTDCEYPHGGASETRYNGDACKTLELSGGSSSAPGNDYSKKRRSFGTEGFR